MLIDDRGRLLGKYNVIDVSVVCFGLILVPLCGYLYGAVRSVLWEPSVTSVKPATSWFGEFQQVVIEGMHFDAGTTVQIGDHLFNTPALVDSTHLVVQVPPEMSPGRHLISVTNGRGLRGWWDSEFQVEVPAPSLPPVRQLPRPAPAAPVYLVAPLSFMALDDAQSALLTPGHIERNADNRIVLMILQVLAPTELPDSLNVPPPMDTVVHLSFGRHQILALVLLDAQERQVNGQRQYFYTERDQGLTRGSAIVINVDGANLTGVIVADAVPLHADAQAPAQVSVSE